MQRNLTKHLLTQQNFSDAEDLRERLRELTKTGLGCTAYQDHTATFILAEKQIRNFHTELYKTAGKDWFSVF